MALTRPIGTSYPFRNGEPWGMSGGLSTLKSSMLQIVMTMPGERIGRPSFGCEVRRRLFDQSGTKLMSTVKGDIRIALERHEPRVRVLDINVSMKNSGDTLLVTISWQPVNDLENRYDLNIDLPVGSDR